MKNYKIILAYDGTRYNGWQKQGNTENTIQEKLERILKEISGQETEVFGSGRTEKIPAVPKGNRREDRKKDISRRC